MNNKYDEDLLARISAIRASEQAPRLKVAGILKCACDYDAEGAKAYADRLFSAMAEMGAKGDLRFANCMIMYVETWVKNCHPLTMEYLESQTETWLREADNNQHIYEYPSFSGVSGEYDGNNQPIVTLPKEFADFKGRNMILKIEDMDRFVDTFSSRNTFYKRAYALLADLDSQVLESFESGRFAWWMDCQYKDWGFAVFEFSHFEIDLSEPDEKYRTLYVVYRYDTTAS
jgi:hypothetical protein